MPARTKPHSMGDLPIPVAIAMMDEPGRFRPLMEEYQERVVTANEAEMAARSREDVAAKAEKSNEEKQAQLNARSNELDKRDGDLRTQAENLQASEVKSAALRSDLATREAACGTLERDLAARLVAIKADLAALQDLT